MTFPEYQNKVVEQFTNIFNSSGLDHVNTCGCLIECTCKSPREKLESFLTQALSGYRELLVKEIENVLYSYTNYPTQMESKKSFETGEMAKKVCDDILNINLLKE